ncbi:hypothetical protein D3C86_2142630 [compost metagenome]
MAALGEQMQVGFVHGEMFEILADQRIGATRTALPIAQPAKTMGQNLVLESASHHAISSVHRTRTKIEQNSMKVKRSCT